MYNNKELLQKKFVHIVMNYKKYRKDGNMKILDAGCNLNSVIEVQKIPTAFIRIERLLSGL